jgi:Sulfotransferase domain
MKKGSLPTFVIIGAQKSATRWLRVNLGKHPEIFTAPKELHFWNSDEYEAGRDLDRYRSQFQGWRGEPIVGEATPGYMIWRHEPAVVAERMQQGLPDAKLIVVLRNPIDRANSALLHHVQRGRIAAGYRLVDVVNARQPAETDWFCLVSGGWYAASLEPFLERFGDQLLVLLHDDVKTDPVGTYHTALRHVGASPDYTPNDLARVVFSNRSAGTSAEHTLTPEDRAALWDCFSADVARLETMFGMDLSQWAPNGWPS